MFRLFKAELKKIFLKPSIFVVTGLIILMLAASIFLYSPRIKDLEYVKYNSTGLATVNDYYNYFDTSAHYQAKNNIDHLLAKAENYLDYYQSNSNVVEELKSSWTNVKALYDVTSQSDYISLYNALQRSPSDETVKSDLINKRAELKTAIENFWSKYEEYILDEKITFLVTSNLNDKINEHLLTMTSYFTQAERNIDDPDGFIVNNLKNSNLFAKVFEDLDQFLPFAPNIELVNELYDYVNEAKIRNEEQLQVIIDFNSEKQSSNSDIDINELLGYITDYYLNANYAYNIVVDSIKIDGLSKYTAINITKFKGFTDTSIYELQESNAKYIYLFNNHKYQYQFADSFSIIQPSNTQISGYDYSYFALRLCTFFITIYIVVLAAGTIAGEQSSGTLKLLAIRPYGRNKLLSAKILATITVGAILIFVSGLASLVVGGITYGIKSLPVLAVFNSTVAFSINPFLLYLIAMITMFIEILFYAMISIFISTVFKSNVAAVSISTLLFFVSLVLNVIAINQPWIGLIPFVNVNLFKYFGSAFLSNSGKPKLLESILTPSVFAGSTFISSIIIYSISFIIITLATHLVFKRRDIK